MNACMYDYAKEHRKHGEVKSIMWESRVNTPFGKDYGFTCTCITGSTKFPISTTPFWTLSAYSTDSRSNNVRKKVSFECSIVCQLIQDCSWLVTALHPKRPRWVKGNSKGPQLQRTLKK